MDKIVTFTRRLEVSATGEHILVSCEEQINRFIAENPGAAVKLLTPVITNESCIERIIVVFTIKQSKTLCE